MREKDIENLIARYPERFFPNQSFVLVGQQVSLGKCRADILFKDKHKRTIIVEVKRGILSRDASGQIIEYYGLLKQAKPNEVIELILCANTIPAERRLFLERVGIECKEVGVALIAELAKEFNYQFLDEQKVSKEPFRIPLINNPVNTLSSGGNVWIFQASPERYDILNALSDSGINRWCWEINQHKDRIKGGDIALIWMSGKEAGIYAIAKILSDPKMMISFPGEDVYWVNDKDKGREHLRVEIEYIKNMTNAPLFKSDLKNIYELRNLSILNFWRVTNFPVTQDEWTIIKDLKDKTDGR